VHARAGSLRTRSFGVFEADLRAAELRKFGIKIKLLEQPFQLLALLLPHAGELVTSDEIRQALWPVHTLVDFDRACHRALDLVLSAATARSVEAIALEAGLAPGRIELNSRNQSSGRPHLAALEKEADRRGLLLVARKAVAALHIAHEQAPGHPPNQDRNRGLPRSTRA
jgi:hypothetical protein